MWQHEKGSRDIKIDDDLTIKIGYLGQSSGAKGIRLDNEVIPLIAMVPELIEALRRCITEPGAYAYAGHDRQNAMGRRLMAINETAKQAVRKAEGR